MKIVELFRRLSYGELSNLAISGEGSGTILEEKQPQLIQYIDEALLQLFSRFILREKELLIEQVDHITSYHLKRKYAETSGSDVDWPYIKDLPGEPFEEDVIKVLSVWDSNGCPFALNDVGNPLSLFTPQPDVIQVPNPDGGREMSVIYQARHRELDARPGHILNQIIEIPFFLEKALKNYTAHLVYSHMNGQENILKGQEYLASYEAACLDVEQRDLVNQTFHTSHSKLEQRGFV